MNEPARGRSVRFRLLAIALLPMLVILPLLLGVAIYRWNARFDATLISKVNGDLTIAHQYLARILEKTGVQIRALGLSARFRDVEEHDPLSAVGDLLETSRKEIGLDFLYLMDPERKDPRLVTRVSGTAKGRLADHRFGVVGRSPVSRHRHLQQ